MTSVAPVFPRCRCSISTRPSGASAPGVGMQPLLKSNVASSENIGVQRTVSFVENPAPMAARNAGAAVAIANRLRSCNPNQHEARRRRIGAPADTWPLNRRDLPVRRIVRDGSGWADRDGGVLGKPRRLGHARPRNGRAECGMKELPRASLRRRSSGGGGREREDGGTGESGRCGRKGA